MIINATGSKGGGSTPVINPLSVTENGTYTAPSGVDGYSPVVVNVSGGGGGSVEENDVNFYDYDGTCVAAYTAADFANLTAMPSNPSHTGLTAQGWNWSLSDAKAYVAKYGILDIGQMYVTDDGKTRIYCEFVDGRLSVQLSIRLNGTAVIDWGDDTPASTITGTSITSSVTASHDYASGGNYVITMTVTGTAAIYGNSSCSRLIAASYGTFAYVSAISKIEIGANVILDKYAFNKLYNLESITIPSGTTVSDGTYLFANCYKLRSVTLPNTITDIPTYAFNACYGLRNMSIPNTVTTIGSYSINACYVMPRLTIPEGIVTITQSSVAYLTRMTMLKFSDTVTRIENYGLAGNSAITEYHFYSVTPPTLGGSSVFNTIPSDCKIYVPYSADHSILNAYKTATNWSAHASKMVEEEP